MRSKNAKRLVEFRGEHPKLEHGKCYTIAEYVKVCNEMMDWGFYLRFTDADGEPLKGLEYVR